MCVHLYDLLDVLDLVHELHLCHPPDVLELPDPPDHTEQTQKQQKQQHSLQQQRGARALARAPFVVPFDQVVPAHQDDIDEVHELDPVHQVDHKDEFTCSMMIIL